MREVQKLVEKFLHIEQKIKYPHQNNQKKLACIYVINSITVQYLRNEENPATIHSTPALEIEGIGSHIKYTNFFRYCNQRGLLQNHLALSSRRSIFKSIPVTQRTKRQLSRYMKALTMAIALSSVQREQKKQSVAPCKKLTAYVPSCCLSVNLTSQHLEAYTAGNQQSSRRLKK